MAYSDSDLAELRQLFADDTAEWLHIRHEGQIDMRYATGDPWDPAERAIREAAGRNCLSFDELGQYTNQAINEVRANKRAVKFSPVGDGANDETAAFYSDKMREIEYRSRAQIAYTTAFENAIQRSYGYVRVNIRRESARSVNRDIWIDPVHNPDLVTPDPLALMPDLSDMKRCWVREPWRIEDFNAKFGKKHRIDKDSRAHRSLMTDVPTWVSSNVVYVAESWKIKTTTRTLLIIRPEQPAQYGRPLGLQAGAMPEPVIGVFDDEPRPPGEVLETRKVDDRSVYQCLTNGVEILDETDWPGKYIPIVSCFGKIIYDDTGKRQILSMIRLARDPYMVYCYYGTGEAEVVGMTPKFPYFVRRGSLKPDQLLALQKSNHEPVAVIEVEPQVTGMGQTPPEFPMRNPYEPPIAAFEIGKESARRAIQAAMGWTPLPTQAQRRNEKSGVALRRIEESGQKGSFHFNDHYLDMITQVGVVCEDLIDKVYDTARDVGIRKPNDTAEIVRINDPNAKGSINTKGHYLVTVSTGPSFESEREAASDFADTLAQISPEVFALLGPLIVKLKNLGPIGDEMAELLEAVQPPPVQAMRQEKKQQRDPQQAMQELVAVKAQLQQVMQAAQQMQQQLDTDAAKQQATLAKAKLDADTTLAVARMAEQTKMAVAKLQTMVKPGLETEAEAVQGELDRQHDIVLAEIEHAHDMELEKAKAVTARIQLERQAQIESSQTGQEHAHEGAMAERGRQHEAGMAERQHQHALEAGDQQVAGKLAVEQAKPKPQPKPAAE